MVTDDKFKEIAPTYLATTIQYITNRIWFRLNKGFSSNLSLVSLDIVASAKILLSSQINNKVQTAYQKLQQEVQDGNLLEEDIIARYAGYRHDTKSPEEITETNVGDLLNDIISEEYFEKHIREKELKKQEIKRLERENKEKDDLLQEQSLHISTLENKSANERQENYKKRLYTISRLIKKAQKELDVHLQDKERIERKNKQFSRALICTKYLVLIGVITLIICKWGLNLTSIILTIISFILGYIKKPRCLSMGAISKKQKDRLIKKYKFNPQLEIDLRKEIEDSCKERDELINMLK